MQTGFPNKILWFPIGWQDRGKVNRTYIGNDLYKYSACSLCRTKAHMGIENNEPFMFCPKCMVELD